MATFPRGILLGNVNCTDYKLQYLCAKKSPTSTLSVFNGIYEVFPYLVKSPAFLTQPPGQDFEGGHTCQETGFLLGNLVHIAPSERKLRLSWRFFENLCLFNQEMNQKFAKHLEEISMCFRGHHKELILKSM